MTTANRKPSPATVPALEAAARHHLDSAREVLDGMNDPILDASSNPSGRVFWRHMNAAWGLIHRAERASNFHGIG